jgi:hypothetical protein
VVQWVVQVCNMNKLKEKEKPNNTRQTDGQKDEIEWS